MTSAAKIVGLLGQALAGHGAPASLVDAAGDGLTLAAGGRRWRLARVGAVGPYPLAGAVRLYEARPGVTDDPRRRGVVVEADRAYVLDQPDQLAALAGATSLEPGLLACLTALYGDLDAAPRQLDGAARATGTGFTVDTYRPDDDDPDRLPVRVWDRWTVEVGPTDVRWRHEPLLDERAHLGNGFG